MTKAAPVLEVAGLTKHFPSEGGWLGKSGPPIRAVDGIDLAIAHGETLSVVGESGCGKSTLGRVIMGLVPASSGEIRLNGSRIDRLRSSEFRKVRQRMQIIFQDPYSSLNPRMRVRDILAEPIANFRLARTRADVDSLVAGLLEKVRLPQSAADRYPHEFSGGQRQRIGIARALAPNPQLIVCDEAVSALDVSVKAQIINLLSDLQRELRLSLMFISHDLAIVEHLTHRIAVMYMGKIVEIADRRSLFQRPRHPYTRALLSAVPTADPKHPRRRIHLHGDVPDPARPPAGCRFHTRCPFAFDRCRAEEPRLRSFGAAHLAACHLDDVEAAPETRGSRDLLEEAGRRTNPRLTGNRSADVFIVLSGELSCRLLNIPMSRRACTS